MLPVIVAAAPLFLAASACIPFSEWPAKLAGGTAVLVVAAFALAQLARDAGKAMESRFGRPGAVRRQRACFRHCDETFDAGTKAKIHRRLVVLGAVKEMPTAAEEAADLTGAERTYVSCSEWLRSKALQLRKQPPFDVGHDENISYGYRRNLLGIRSYALVITCLSVSLTVATFLLIEAILILILGLYVGCCQ